MLNSLVVSVFVLGDAESLALNIFLILTESNTKHNTSRFVLLNVLSLGAFPKATGVICRVLLSVVVIDNSEPLSIFIHGGRNTVYVYIKVCS